MTFLWSVLVLSCEECLATSSASLDINFSESLALLCPNDTCPPLYHQHSSRWAICIATTMHKVFFIDFSFSHLNFSNDKKLMKVFIYWPIKWRNILTHVRSFFLVLTSSHSCTVHLFIFEWSVPILPHVQSIQYSVFSLHQTP